MANYPILVNIAWYVIEEFLRDWQNEPYKWSKEIDIQAELFSRLSSVYKNMGCNTILANYSDPISGFKNNQKWGRVSCEPQIQYTYKDGRVYKCYPDIVIWDDIDDPNAPPDEKEGVNFPMLLTIEIKLEGQTEENNQNWDIEKMKYLIKQRDTKYACWLNLLQQRAKTGSGILWELADKKRLWICTGKLPPLRK